MSDAADSAPLAVYRFDYSPDSSYGSAVRLIQAAGEPGLVLDLGCGYGAIAGPLADTGWRYVGVDVDGAAIDTLSGAGVEAAVLDLDATADEVASGIRAVVAGRPLRAIAALDVLEHLRDPAACLAAVSSIAEENPGLVLVVSLPNVTHVDVAAKLLAGRWDAMDTGLLDRTHRHFFDETSAVSLLEGAGWAQVAADDVLALYTEQAVPADLPSVRPESPLNDLLRSVRDRAGRGGSTTFQFVRRYEHRGGSTVEPPGERRDEQSFTVVVMPRADLDAVAADLRAQVVRSFEVVLCQSPPEIEGFAEAAGLPERSVTVVDRLDRLDDAIRASAGRYVCAIGPSESVTPNWLAALDEGVRAAPGRVVTGMVTDSSGADVSSSLFDLISHGSAGAVVAAAYAVPRAAVAVGAMSFEGGDAQRAASLARSAMWCGRHDRGDRICSSTEPVALRSLVDEVVAILDEDPVVFARGAVGALLVIHDAAADAVAARDAAERKVADLEAALTDRVAYHDTYARSVETALDELHTKIVAAGRQKSAGGGYAERMVGALRHRLRG